MSILVERAKAFAIAAHEAIGQKRNYTGAPYWTHPEDVADIVACSGGSDVMIAAAWLHDVVEDTPITLKTIREQFGDEVADLVGWLTDVSRPGDGPRHIRRTLDRLHTAKAPAEAKTIKVADLIANSGDIVTNAPGFANTYLVEMRLLLGVLTEANLSLLTKAWMLWERNRNKVGMTLSDVDIKTKPYLQSEATIVNNRKGA